MLHSKDGSAVDVRSMQGNLERLRARAAMEMLVGSDRMRGFEDHRVVALRRQIGEGDQGDWREGWMQVQRLLDELRGQVTDEQARKEEVFAKAKDDAERIHVISNFLCDPQAGDSPADSSLKAKWRKLFADFTEGRVTAVDLVRTLKRDVEGMHKKEKDAMNELSDLVSAQTAKGKEKEEAEEKRRKAEAEARKSCERCGKVVSGENEVCCVRCWEGRGREKMVGGWYCSEECGREDAKGHNERYHKQS